MTSINWYSNSVSEIVYDQVIQTLVSGIQRLNRSRKTIYSACFKSRPIVIYEYLSLSAIKEQIFDKYVYNTSTNLYLNWFFQHNWSNPKNIYDSAGSYSPSRIAACHASVGGQMTRGSTRT